MGKKRAAAAPAGAPLSEPTAPEPGGNTTPPPTEPGPLAPRERRQQYAAASRAGPTRNTPTPEPEAEPVYGLFTPVPLLDARGRRDQLGAEIALLVRRRRALAADGQPTGELSREIAAKRREQLAAHRDIRP